MKCESAKTSRETGKRLPAKGKEASGMELSERKKEILKSVVDAYIASGEPVGSKFLTTVSQIPLSSATIRNEMSELEEMGYLEQPHTSAGRIPSAQGYRLYVNELMEKRTLPQEEEDKINASLSGPMKQLDQVMSKAGQMVSTLVGYPAYTVADHKSEVTIRRFELIAVDAATIATIRTADKLAPLDATVLIVGERGVGKSTVAKYIHSKSARKKGKFVTVSCGAIPPETMNEELFGVARDGEVRPGLFETGSGGTIFLNEVGELPPDIQMKVCRLIHEKTITRVGSPDPVRVDARVLASTSHDLEQLTAEKKLQEEFYYCLNALPVEVPPLRRRREDIIPFVQFFASELNKKYNMKKKFSQTALLGLKSYDWPGNVRELHNVVERTIVLSGRNPIELEDLPISDEIRLEDEDLAELTEPVDLRAILRQVERSYLDRAYARFGNVRDAAKSLGLDPSTFVRRRKRDAQ